MKLLTLEQASKWASKYLNREITKNNISYLVQYGRVQKSKDDGNIYILKEDLESYYKTSGYQKKATWKDQLGDDLNWALSFDNYRESERTKHVHRLHPYKGKFIPQLVEYFLDDHIDDFKKETYFNPGDLILDPFCGSGTALVQANELGMHAVGIDISAFNALISNAKVSKYNKQDFYDLSQEINLISRSLYQFLSDKHVVDFEKELLGALAKFNNSNFPSPEYRYKVNNRQIDEKKYGYEKSKEFLSIYRNLVEKYNIEINQKNNGNFLDKWYFKSIRDEIDFVFDKVKRIKNRKIKIIISIILSRTIRSCRATTHSDLATLVKPINTTYYCTKHKKICKPLFSIRKWWNRYSKDTLVRLQQFDKIRTDTQQVCLTGDSMKIDLLSEAKGKNPDLGKVFEKQKVRGIFSSPPYVGLINYHEQHAYAYALYGFTRKDDKEIGPLSKGRGKEAREAYINGISKVLVNCERFLVDDYDVFLVANDKFNIYPKIAAKAEMKIVNKYKRPVLNRTERDKRAYSEIIFHLKSDK